MTAPVEVTRVYQFRAAHQLGNTSLPPASKATIYGACARPHGHNYYVEVTIAGVPDPVTGMAVDLRAVDRVVDDLVIAAVDHQSLETVPALAGVITTGESLARAFWRLLRPALPAGALCRVAVQETAKNRFEYEGEVR